MKGEKKILGKLEDAIVNLGIEGVQGACKEAIKTGIPAYKAVTDGMAKGMEIVGEKYENNEYFLAELIMPGETMKEGMKVLEPHLKAGDVKTIGKVVIGTVRGDLHDIGKNVVVTLLNAAGFDVVDLGVDVPLEKFVETVVIGDYLEDDDLRGTLVSSMFHEKYGIEVGDKLYGFEREFIVRGFFDPEALESLRDLDAQNMIPYMIQPPTGILIPCDGDAVIILTYDTALQMPDVSTSRVVIQLEGLEDYPTFAYMIAYSREYTVFIVHPDSLEMQYLGGYLEEKGTGLIPSS